MGFRINGKYLQNLRFVDDNITFTINKSELQQLEEELHYSCNNSYLEMSLKKTEILYSDYIDCSDI